MSEPPCEVIGSNAPETVLPKRVSTRSLPPPVAPTLGQAAHESAQSAAAAVRDTAASGAPDAAVSADRAYESDRPYATLNDARSRSPRARDHATMPPPADASQRGDRLQQLRRKVLLAAPVRAPRILFQLGQSLAEVVDREVIRPQPRAQLVPRERNGNRGTRLGTRGKRRDGSIGAVVAQVIQQDLPLAPGFRKGRRIEAGALPLDGLGNAPRKRQALVPAGLRNERHHHVQADAARGLHETLQLQRIEC